MTNYKKNIKNHSPEEIKKITDHLIWFVHGRISTKDEFIKVYGMKAYREIMEEYSNINYLKLNNLKY